VAVHPYATALAPRAVEALLGALHDAAGDAADVRFLDPVAYGEEALPPPPWHGEARDGAPRVRAVVFSLAQTPEPEVHARALAAAASPEADVVAIVDESPWHASGAPAARVEERRRAWDAALAAGGVPVVHANLGAGAPDPGLSRRLAAALERRIA
jgi:hypothetical protein